MKTKTFLMTSVMVSLVAVIAFFYACASKDAESVKPSKVETAEYEKAGIGHNKCLDVFYSKLQKLRAEKTRGDGGDDDAPKDDDDDKFLPDDEREALVSTIVEMFESLAIDEEMKATMQSEFSEIIEKCDAGEGEDTIIWSDTMYAYGQRLVNLVESNYETAQLINAITALENEAKNNLPETEKNYFLMNTSITRNSLEYWDANYGMWFPEDETRAIPAKVIKVANADIDGILRATGIGALTAGGAAYGAAQGWRYVSAVCRTSLKWLCSWEVQLAIATGWAAVSSIAEAVEDEEDKGPDLDTDYGDMKLDFCCTVMLDAISDFVDDTEDNSGAEEDN